MIADDMMSYIKKRYRGFWNRSVYFYHIYSMVYFQKHKMGSYAFDGLCNLSDYHDWFTGFNWLEGHCHIIKLHRINADTQHGNEYSFNSKIFTIKKEFPNLSTKEAVLRSLSKNDFANSLYCFNYNMCFFIFNF